MSTYVQACIRSMHETNWVIKCGIKSIKRGASVELGYLRSPPALSAGPHMENQASGPLGTDVCSPLDSSQSATEAVQEPGPLAIPYLQPQVIHTWTEERERELCFNG